jgi:hypothetical protein
MHTHLWITACAFLCRRYKLLTRVLREWHAVVVLSGVGLLSNLEVGFAGNHSLLFYWFTLPFISVFLFLPCLHVLCVTFAITSVYLFDFLGARGGKSRTQLTAETTPRSGNRTVRFHSNGLHDDSSFAASAAPHGSVNPLHTFSRTLS